MGHIIPMLGALNKVSNVLFYATNDFVYRLVTVAV